VKTRNFSAIKPASVATPTRTMTNQVPLWCFTWYGVYIDPRKKRPHGRGRGRAAWRRKYEFGKFCRLNFLVGLSWLGL